MFATTTCSVLLEIGSNHDNFIIEIVCERLSCDKVLAFGENFFDIENMHFWGTLKFTKNFETCEKGVLR